MHYFNCLKGLFNDGVKRYAEDTPERSEFVLDNQHVFAGTVLCSMFAYLESTLGGKSESGGTWIDRHGGPMKSHLECLRIVRNAFVHSNSYVGDLQNVTEVEKKRLRAFITDLESGNIKDDRGNKFPCYMSISTDDKITFNQCAIHIFCTIGKTLSH